MTPSVGPSIGAQRPDVLAAGSVVWRRRQEVLLVHRPRYDDWSFPKGKRDPGESLPAAAVREVAEETGLEIRLGPPLATQRYRNGDRMKTVHYWVGWAVGSDDVSGYLVNSEIDDVRWVPWESALEKLTYPYDHETLRASRRHRRKSRALIVLRHGSAESRKSWPGDDRLRPMTAVGHRQAERLVPLLAAYDVSRVVTSTNTRCRQTVEPYAEASGLKLEEHDGLSEEDATVESVVEIVDDLLHAGEGSVLCTHRPVLPSVFDALGLGDVRLEPGGLLVVHHRKGGVRATQPHHSG
jgi:8-oxo-(d)GTP phosphatase